MVHEREVTKISVNKYSKHQKSKYPRYVLTDEEGNVIVSANTEEEFRENRHGYLMKTNSSYKTKFNKKLQKASESE